MGLSQATFSIPFGPPALAGITLHHAYIAFNPGAVTLASNAVPVTFVQ